MRKKTTKQVAECYSYDSYVSKKNFTWKKQQMTTRAVEKGKQG